MRPLLPLVLVANLVGCSHEGVVAGPVGATSLRTMTPQGSSITVEGYGDVGPTATLTIKRKGSSEFSADAADLCRAEDGLYVRHATLGCAKGVRVALWDDIEEVRIKEFDGLSTVAVTAGSALIVAGAVVMLSAASGAGKSTKSAPSSSPNRVPARPTVGDTPTPRPPVREFPAGGPSSGSTHTTIIVAPTLSLSSNEPIDTPSETPSGTVVETGVASVASPSAVPLIDEQAVRHDQFALFGRLGGSTCVLREACTAGAVSVGARFANFLELSGGAQFDASSNGIMPMLGVGIQGTAPTERWIALYLGTTFAFNASNVRVDPAIGFRILPTRMITLGAMPLGFSYTSAKGKFLWSPGLDLTASF